MTNINHLPSLPNGWGWTQIQDISETTSGGTPSRKNKDFFSGEIPWLKSGELADNLNINSAEEAINQQALDNSSAKIIPKGSLLVALYGATVGKLGLLTIDAAINQAICAIQPYQGVFPKYLFYYLSSYRKNFLNARKGGAQPNISQEIVKTALVPLAPAAEQLRIISKVEELFSFLDAGVESLRKVQALLKRYRQAVLKYAFEGKLTEEWRKTHKDQIEPAQKLLERIRQERRNTRNGSRQTPQIDIVDMPELPYGGVETRIGDICDLINGRAFKPSEWASAGVPIIRIQNLNDPKAEFNYCNFEVEEKYKVDNGQLLFAWSGTPETSFGAHIWNRGKAVLNQHIFKVNINENYLDKTFLKHLLNRNVKEYIVKAHGTAGLAHITKGKFEDSQIFLPPFEEQKRIASEIESRFSVSDRTEKEITYNMSSADRLRQSILRDAFAGKLVSQDSTDEPAARLLERIKAERLSRKAESSAGSNNKKPKINLQAELSRYVE